MAHGAGTADLQVGTTAVRSRPSRRRIALVASIPMSRDLASSRCVHTGHGRRQLALAGAVVATLGLGSNDDRAEAYLFYDNGALDYIVPASEAIRWSNDAWSPGRTLVWEIEDGPDWPLLLDHSAEDFGAYVEEALSVWSGISTADISWRLSGVVERSEEPRFGDSHNRVFFDAEDWIPGSTAWWIRNHDGDVWEIAECDVGVPYYWLRWLEENEDFDSDDLRRNAIGFLRREFGHCLGLHRPAYFPASQRLRASRAEDDELWHRTEVWRPGSVMQGWASPSPDDQVGASLLRPRAGWLSSSGSVAGVLESDGKPVAYAHVYALRVGGDGLRDPVGAFSNADGEFLIEGLPSGNYVLWGHPVRWYWAHRPLIESGAATDLRDTVLANPARVQAGSVTEGLAIQMRRGRE